MLSYRYTVTPDDNDTLLIQFPGLPEGAAVAPDRAHVAAQAAEGLEAVLQMYIDARRPIPIGVQTGDERVSLGGLVTAKILLSNEMVRQGMRKAELARRLGMFAPQIDRLLDLSHRSKLDAIEAALAELGRSLEVSVV